MEEKIRINKADYLLFTLFSCWLLVDMLNGFLLRSDFPISVSQIYKSVVALLVIIRCAKNSQIQSVLFCSVVYLSFYSSIVILNGEEVVGSLVLLSKLITSILFFVYFSIIREINYDFFKNKAFLVLKWSFIIFFCNLIAGYLGYGFSSYSVSDDEGFGSRGFFYAINELSGVLAVVYAWAFYYCKTHFSFPKYLLCSMLLFYMAYTLSTKSGIVASAIFFLYITYHYGNKKQKIMIVGLIFVLVVSAVVIVQILLSSDLPLFQRINFALEHNGVLDALTSNRLNFWEEESKEFVNSNFLSKLFGLGGNKTVEMDPFDALLNCGILGLGVLLYFYFKGIIKPLRSKFKNIGYNKVIFISNCLLILMSIGGGHIMFSSMAGMLIALSNALLYNVSCKLQVKKIKL